MDGCVMDGKGVQEGSIDFRGCQVNAILPKLDATSLRQKTKFGPKNCLPPDVRISWGGQTPPRPPAGNILYRNLFVHPVHNLACLHLFVQKY